VSDITTAIDAYLAMWNERDVSRRAGLIEAAWAPDGLYADPLFEAQGHSELNSMVSAAQTKFPNHDLRPASGIDAHHDSIRFTWEVVSPDGAPALSGIDIGLISDDGRLRRMVGFFGDVPPKTSSESER
jgi:hypothetical protein